MASFCDHFRKTHLKVIVNDRFYKVLATRFCASQKSDFCNGFKQFSGAYIFHSILPSIFLSKTKVLRFGKNASLTSDKPNAFSMIVNHFLWKWRKLPPNHLRFIMVFNPASRLRECYFFHEKNWFWHHRQIASRSAIGVCPFCEIWCKRRHKVSKYNRFYK